MGIAAIVAANQTGRDWQEHCSENLQREESEWQAWRLALRQSAQGDAVERVPVGGSAAAVEIDTPAQLAATWSAALAQIRRDNPAPVRVEGLSCLGIAPRIAGQ
jgi:hypothetical protein